MNLQELLFLPVQDLDFIDFITNILIGAILAQILAFIYTKYGHSLSNRKIFSRNFLLITLTTFLVISVVKSSLALSLGLIGALSIVRFRAAIKEPEELAYLFLTIAIGLGLGAGEKFSTILTFIFIALIIIIKNKFYSNTNGPLTSQYFTISIESNKIGLIDIESILINKSIPFKLKRIDRNDKHIELMFLVELSRSSLIQELDDSLKKLKAKNQFSILDHNTNAFTSP